MICPQCQSELHTNSSGLLLCQNCDYIELAPIAIDPTDSQMPAVAPLAIESQSFFKIHKMYIFIATTGTLIVLFVFLGLQQMRAAQLLNDAVALNQKQQFTQSVNLLQQASGTIALPQTKQSIDDNLNQTKKMIASQDTITKTTQIVVADSSAAQSTTENAKVSAVVLPTHQ